MYNYLRHFIGLTNRRAMSSISSNCFKLSNYDVVGLDFDNTLLQYNLSNLFRLHYNYLTTYLVENKGYKGLSTSMSNSDVDFIRKGLFLDFNRGNILNISGNGTIMQASHGTKKLSINELIDVYGLERKWPPTDMFIKKKTISIANNETYGFLDFTDCAAIVVYAKAIDLMDNKHSTEYRPVWHHLLEAIVHMYSMDSKFISTVGKNLSTYYHKCEPKVIEWLKKLKENCKLMLITSGEAPVIKVLAEYCLGSNWQDLFHTIIDTAQKPYFFTDKNSYKDINNKQIELNTSRGYYRHGNWLDLHRILTEELGRPVKCIYIGDNLIHDVYAPSIMGNIALDTVSVVEETLAEGYFPGIHPHRDFIKSNFWGSYIEEDGIPTVMGDIMMKHSKLCIPMISYFIDKSFDYEHVPFWIGFKSYEDNIKQSKATSSSC